MSQVPLLGLRPPPFASVTIEWFNKVLKFVVDMRVTSYFFFPPFFLQNFGWLRFFSDFLLAPPPPPLRVFWKMFLPSWCQCCLSFPVLPFVFLFGLFARSPPLHFRLTPVSPVVALG